IGNFVHLYFAAPGSLSDGATASTMIFFSCGVRSRSCDAGVAAAAAAGAVAGAALAAGWSAGGDAAQAASATLAARTAIALPVFVRKVAPFVVATIPKFIAESQLCGGLVASFYFSFGSSDLTVSITAGGVW